jgi:hypothetical protein
LTYKTSAAGNDAGETRASSRAPTLDVVVPVHDEAAVLAASVTLLLATWGLVAGAHFRLFAGVARRARAPRRRAADHEDLGEQAA